MAKGHPKGEGQQARINPVAPAILENHNINTGCIKRRLVNKTFFGEDIKCGVRSAGSNSKSMAQHISGITT
jgi:hypothetical protein